MSSIVVKYKSSWVASSLNIFNIQFWYSEEQADDDDDSFLDSVPYCSRNGHRYAHNNFCLVRHDEIIVILQY